MQSVRTRRAATAATALAAVAVGQALLSAAIFRDHGDGWSAWADSNSAVGVLAAIGFAVVAVAVIRHRADNVLGWIFVLVAGLNATGALAAELVAVEVEAGERTAAVVAGAWVGANAWWLALLILLGAVAWLFPDGQLPPRPWRRVVVGVWLLTAGLAVLAVVSGELVLDRFPGLRSVVPAPLPGVVATAAGNAAYILAVLSGLAGTARLVVRLRRAQGRQRSQLSWFVVACLVVAVVPHLPPAPWSSLVAVGLFPLCLGVAILQHGLFGGDRLLSRTLVYTLLTGSVLGVLAIAARAVGGGLAGTSGGLVLAALVLTFGLAPLQRTVQRLVDRLLHAPARDPYVALRTVTSQLGSRSARGEPLEAIAEAVARSLGAQDVTIVATPVVLPTRAAPTTLAAQVSPAAADDRLAVPLHFAGEPVGTLLVRLRPAGPGRRRRHLSALDQALLDDMAELVAVAVRTTALLDEARGTREASLLALEEERRRIRADLHDGLGPALAGVALSLSAIADSPTVRGTETGAMLARLHTQTQASLDDVQHIVHGLRPSALDGLGLLGALGEHAESLTDAGPTTFTVQEVDGGGSGPVPAAVELAAYRVAMEAMTNVARHAHATRCSVRLAVGPDALTLDVHDDGSGIVADATRSGGLGLHTMQQRAADLGGRTTLTSAPGSTTVSLHVPIARAP